MHAVVPNTMNGLKTAVLTALAIALLLTVAACRPDRVAPPPPKPDPVHGLSTPRIAILPFRDQTGEAGIAYLMRVSLYSHLSVRPFRDIELSVVDTRLEGAGNDPLAIHPVPELGRQVGADLVLTGDTLLFHRVYAGVYSQMSIEAAIQLWDTDTGRQIWSDRRRIDSHEGGLPLNILEIPLIGVRSGYHLRDRNKIRIVDELARYLAGRVPMPESAARPPSTKRFELQVHAFSERVRAEDTLHGLREQGYPAYLQSSTVGNRRWHRVILGPYERREEAEDTRDRLPRDLSRGAFVRELPP